ncbi:VOC family protein [Natroniella sulfidigena]|uniref:VOC family protein n=1 Tax=Natroniella sulfidigena TaxID=723921 RepID=UPI00200B2CB7|nr:VOC family protein [Natroniella sulfidigena]MCK8817580.1 VOC family protein [Natroniella sulfidigena]
MKFNWCTITVGDMEESLEFYQKIVGLEVSQEFTIEEEIEIAFLGSGETKVELIFDPNKEAADNPEGISLGFEVESFDEQLDFVKEEGLEVVGPFQPVPNIRFFFVKDPNGVSIQFVEQN